MAPSCLVLKTGEVFEGCAPEWQQGAFFGEVVFSTGMTGYVESLTDPSYAGQILVFTYPLIGNYGVPAPETWESQKIHAAGVVLSEPSLSYHHYAAKTSFVDWLKSQGVPLLYGVDTRALTKRIRSHGVILGAIAPKAAFPRAFPEMDTQLVRRVSTPVRKKHGQGKKKIIAVDCGMKENIVRSFLHFPVELVQVPFDADYTDEDWDGVFISNGPGDPAACTDTIRILRKAMSRKKPIFGICLGTQLMALAASMRTFKLPFGHRGHNQPCERLEDRRCFLTSQNHGYAIDEASLPPEWKVSFRNLNDGTIEGIEHTSLPFFSVQFHPEASPGPVDTTFLFEKFYGLLS